MSILGRFSVFCASIAGKIPSSLPRLWKEHYVVQHILELVGTVKMKNPNSYIRGRCGATLFVTVELVSGQKIFYPFLMYCYLGLESSLEATVGVKRVRDFL